jgi:hypothetical protein
MESAQELEILRSRSVGDQIGFTFTFLRENFRELSKCVLFIAGPGVLIASAITVYLSMGMVGGGFFSIGAFLLPVVIMTIVVGLLTTVINEYVVLYAERGPEGAKFNEVWEETRRDVAKVIVTTLIVAVGAAIGMLFFVIPGIYLVVLTSVIVTVRVNERTDLGDAFSRSSELVKGQWWPTFGLIVIMLMIYSVLRLVFSIPLWAGMLVGTLGPDDGNFTGGLNWLLVIGSIIASVGSFFVSGLPVLAMALHYFNLVEKYDAPGLMARIEQIGQPDNQESADASFL